MVRTEPSWTIGTSKPVTRWYGHVTLLPEHVLGQWICVERRSGRVLWERDMERPNAVCGIHGGVIVATEQCYVGVGNSAFDCYALALTTGKLLWTSHPSGGYGPATKEHYMYPHHYDHRGAAAAPRLVEDGRCFYTDGRVVDPASGRELGRLSEKDVELRATRQPADAAHALYWSRRRHAGVSVAPGRRLSGLRHGMNALSFRLTDDSGSELWTFDPRALGYEVPHPNFYTFRLAGEYVYVVAAEPLPVQPPAVPCEYQPPPPRLFHLLTLHVETGRVRQDVPIGDTKSAECRIEDVDEDGLVLSRTGVQSADAGKVNALYYFERPATSPAPA